MHSIIRWRYLLPVLQISLVLFLQSAGRRQEQRYLASLDAAAVSDYLPPAAQAANMINFPALVASAPVRLWGKPESLVYRLSFLVCVGLLWFFLGAALEGRPGLLRAQPGERSRNWYGLATLGGLVCLLCALYSLKIVTSYPLVGLGGLIWSIGGVIVLSHGWATRR